MTAFDDELMGITSALGLGGGQLATRLPAPVGSWGGAIVGALGGIISTAAELYGAYTAGREVIDTISGGLGRMSPSSGMGPQLPALPALSGGGMIGTTSVGQAVSAISKPGGRSANDCLADPQVIATLQAVQEGRITDAEGKARLRALGCLTAKRKKRRKCPPGMSRRKMCAPRPSSVCGRPRRPARRKKCGRCVGACSCRRKTHRRLTAKQLRAGFGGKRRMR